MNGSPYKLKLIASVCSIDLSKVGLGLIRRESRGFCTTSEAKEHASKMVFKEIERLTMSPLVSSEGDKRIAGGNLELKFDGSQVSDDGVILPSSSSPNSKYSDIVSYRFQVLWEEHQEPNWGRFVYSCRVIRAGGERVFVGKRLFKDLVEAKEDLAIDVVKSLHPDALC
jgi:hypothetical protein